MAVEQLVSERIRKIGDLHEVEKQPERNALKLYRGLQASPLYDSERQQWVADMSEWMVSSNRPARAQLIGIMAEALFDKDKAKQGYTALQQTPLYDKENERWVHSLQKNQTILDERILLTEQLLGVLVESIFDKNKASKQYEKLKEEFYDVQDQQWRDLDWTLSQSMEPESTDQLLGVMIENLFDTKNARIQYERLKMGELFNQEEEIWDTGPGLEFYDSNVQLLGILTEGLFDKSKAEDRYNRVKLSPLYSSEKQLWRNYMGEDIGLSDNFSATDQLLGVLVEKMFEDNANLVKEETAVPVVRRF